MLLRLAFRNLFRNKGRTFITAASIFLAVILSLMMRSLQFGVYDNMIKNVVGFYTGYAQVHQEGYWQEKSLDNSLEDTPELRQQLESVRGVKGLVPRLESFALASFEDKTKGVLVTGIDIEAEANIINVGDKMTAGRYFEPNEKSTIVSSGLAEQMGIEVNDTLVLLGQGYQGTNAAGKYPVVGIMRLGSPELNGNLVFLPLQTAQDLYGAENRLTAFALLIGNAKKIDQITKTTANKIGDSFDTMSWKQMLPELIQLIEADNIAGLLILGILYIIIGFGIFGTIVMMTNERIYEFGVLISIGMKRWRLIGVMMLESIMVSFLGVIIGVVLGFPILLYFYYNPIHLGKDLSKMSERYDLEPVLNFSLDPEIFWTQALYVFVIALLVNAYPIYKILKLKEVEALRA